MEKSIILTGVNRVEVDLEKHQVPVSMVKCIDPRFNKASLAAMTAKYEADLANCDQLAWAGGAYRLAEGEEFALGEVEKSVRLHHPDVLLITSHTDCGMLKACGITFENPAAELAYHQEMLARAEGKVRQHLLVKGLHVPEIRLEIFSHHDGC